LPTSLPSATLTTVNDAPSGAFDNTIRLF
jgi:hypothetical protein